MIFMMQTFHSLQFDNKRREVESWLARMDVWLGQMRPVGSTAEMLDVQVREQKVNLNIYFHLCISDFMFISNFEISYFHFSSQSFHAEVHQYKTHIEDFNHLTQELISTYQQDDTTNIKEITKVINQR